MDVMMDALGEKVAVLCSCCFGRQNLAELMILV